MKLLVTGAAGFIGSTYVRIAGAEHEIVVLDKLTYAGRRENLPDGVELIVGGIEDPAKVREAMEGAEAVVNFAAESHVDRSIDDQDAFARTHVIGTGTLLDAARELGVGRYLQVSTDEVYGSIESGSFTETSPLDPSSPYSATKAAGDLLVSAHFHTYGTEASIVRGSNNYGPRQYPEKLIPLITLNALHGDSLPVYGDGRQVRNWLYVEDFCRGIHAVLMNGRPGEAYNVGGPDECENIEVIKRVIELTGQDESLIEYVKRPPRPRPPLLARLRQAPRRARLGGPGPLRRGAGEDRRLVPRQRGVVGADPLRRVPRVLRKAVRPVAGLMAERLPTKLDGVVLIEPVVHGDERGFMVESFSRDAWAQLGVDVEFVQHNHSRSAKGTLRGIHFQTEPGQAKLIRCPRGEILDVAVDLRRGSPTYGQWEAHLLDDVKHRQLFVPVGFGHGFAVLSDVADVAYLVSSLYDPATEKGIAWDDPDVGVEWRVAEPLLSERDKTAPKLSEIAESLPF